MVTSSSKVTATEVGVEQDDVVVVVVFVDVPVAVVVTEVDVKVVVTVPEMGVWLVGHELVGAVEYVPEAEVDEQTAGTLEALGSPQEYGTTPARRAAAVKNAAYDHVRS